MKKLTSALKIALLYSVFGISWVGFSDVLLKRLYPDLDRILFIQSAKGMLFVLLTGTVVYFLVRTELKKEEALKEQLLTAIEEKDALLREIHHRVKNNLQVISSLLMLQESVQANGECSDGFLKSDLRIRAMALVHEHLYETGRYARIDLKSYTEDLVSMLSSSLSDGKLVVRFVLDVEPVETTLERAVSYGLILDELIVNSYRHAFRDRTEGRITLSLRKNGTLVSVTAADDGSGIGSDFRARRNAGLGFTFMDSIIRQLKGRLILTAGEPGTRASFHFPNRPNAFTFGSYPTDTRRAH